MGNLERFWLVILIAAPLAAIVAEPAPIANGCPDRCGNVEIPYPFGTREGCYYNEDFLISCDDTFRPPLAFLWNSNINVTNITLEGRVQIRTFTARDCYDQSGHRINGSGSHRLTWLRLKFNSSFTISDNENKFVAVGCDTEAEVTGIVEGDKSYTAGCKTICDRIDYVANDTCSGIGCCQISIAKGMSYIDITVRSYKSHKKVWTFNPCSYGFVVEQSQFHFSPKLLRELQNVIKLPMVLDWSIRDENDTCGKTKKAKACQGNSTCFPVDDNGYRCKCLDGFEGNPYLPSGCQDIDECSPPNRNPCKGGMLCTNTEGNYTCSCPKGYHFENGTAQGCVANHRQNWNLILVTLGKCTCFNPLSRIGGLAFFLVVGTWLFWGYNKWKLIKLKQKFFMQNGGLMLQQQLSNHEGSTEVAKIFTAEELEKATNNFDESKIIGQGGYGTVYKGTLRDERIVAIKKSHIIDQSQNEQFINEVVVLSQINHRNVVKLLGCCLETEVPLLVYEFITNGTLHHHIQNKSKASSLTWEIRLRIATETAGVLSYLHSTASTPIIHRDIKSTNILLDDSYTAKVSDFGTSRLVPQDQAGISTVVQGTIGYLDPEYLRSSQLTDKSDVYSFGVVLLELLTGEKVFSFDRTEEERNLSMYFLSAMKDNCLGKILDGCIVNEANIEQLNEVANLARRCLSVKGEERPTMKDVAMELEGLRRMTKHPWANDAWDAEEVEHLLGETSDKSGHDFDASGSMTVVSNTFPSQVELAIRNGR
ncbi:hypothetical protein SLEP1_g11445 [Rubroshorea leprosula]|uniref:Wall-associated receptor kinase 2-like n=1 Tax=Rubroshorea leprosula TaxID=152421 RepID=A0AAV5IH35_9ROSI|nr:hypothetical protein SLEP1_g11445 [Rubroshorea leprosula]